MGESKMAEAQQPSYWSRWQVPVCALVFVVPAVVSVILINKQNGKKRTPKSSSSSSSMPHLWLPRWRFLHPRWLLFYRALAFLTMAFLLYQIVLSLGFFAFFFYTQWTFTLVVVYFALATLISVHGCWIHSTKSSEQSGEDDKFIKYQGLEQQVWLWGNLMEHIYQACAGAVMLTDIVFWCLLVPFMLGEEFQLTLLIAFMHSVNAVFLILDSVLNSLPFPWFGMVYFVLWSCSYVVFQWGLHVCCCTWWPYPFLDLSNPWAPMWYLALALVHIPCYGLYVLLVKGKDLLCTRMFADSYLRNWTSSDNKQS